MSYFQWASTLSVGDLVIDCDHQSLINLINELYVAAERKEDGVILGSILQRLFNYTSEHFDREERLMEQIQYQDALSHIKQHKKLLERVLLLQASLAEKRDYVAKETAELLRFWLTSHIYTNDMALAAAAKKYIENS